MGNGKMTTTQQNSKPQKFSFSQVINTSRYQQALLNSLGDEKAVKEFTTTLISAYNKTPAIQDCTPTSIIGAALHGQSLKLSSAPQLGHFYMVPFKQKEKRDKDGNITQEECMRAEFVLGYHGYIQLALRTGRVRKITVVEIKDGELNSFDPLNETIDYIAIKDPIQRKRAKTIGYYARLELIDGFVKVEYWTKEEMIEYANEYSPAFNSADYRRLQNNEIPQKELWKYSSFWYKNFDAMAKKTMIRQILGHWCPMSVDFQNAYLGDGQIVDFSDSGRITRTDEEDIIADVIDADVTEVTQQEFKDVSTQVNLEDL